MCCGSASLPSSNAVNQHEFEFIAQLARISPETMTAAKPTLWAIGLWAMYHTCGSCCDAHRAFACACAACAARCTWTPDTRIAASTLLAPKGLACQPNKGICTTCLVSRCHGVPEDHAPVHSRLRLCVAQPCRRARRLAAGGCHVVVLGLRTPCHPTSSWCHVGCLLGCLQASLQLQQSSCHCISGVIVASMYCKGRWQHLELQS